MNLIKVKFLRHGEPAGRPYTYESPIEVKVGDLVQINETGTGVVVATDVPEEEVAQFRDKLKSIVGLIEKHEAEKGEK